MVKTLKEDDNELYQCQAWCEEHSSCNLEIIEHAVESKKEES